MEFTGGAQELYLNRGFAFQASAWFEAAPVFVELSRVWRQKDAKLVSVLNRVRKGVMSSDDCAFLNYHCATVSRPNTVAVPAATGVATTSRTSGMRCQREYKS